MRPLRHLRNRLWLRNTKPVSEIELWPGGLVRQVLKVGMADLGGRREGRMRRKVTLASWCPDSRKEKCC